MSQGPRTDVVLWRCAGERYHVGVAESGEIATRVNRITEALMKKAIKGCGSLAAALVPALALLLAVPSVGPQAARAESLRSTSAATDFSAERRGGRPVNRGNTNVVVRKKTTVVVRPVRVWTPRPYYGTFIAGVALGTVIGVAVAGAAPPPPGPNMCWYWSSPAKTQGYWDYCVNP